MRNYRDELLFQMRAVGLNPKTEHRFHPTRRWRFDMCFPDQKVACEYEGIHSKKSRHLTIGGFIEDCSKYNSAAAMGYHVFRFTAKDVKSGEAVKMIEKAVERGRQVRTK